MRICIFNHPSSNNFTPLDNLLRVLIAITPDIHCILGEYEYDHHKNDKQLTCCCIPNITYSNPLLRISNYFHMQIRVVKKMYILRNNVDAHLFFIGGDTLFLPILFAKLMNKKVILLLAGSSIKSHQMNQDRLTVGLKILRSPCLTLANKIIVYSPILIQDYQLEKSSRKILISHRHFLDFNAFTVTTSFPDRPPIIGYIGRLSGEKGVQHFVQALPAILNDRQELCVLIGGDGQLKEALETSLGEGGLISRVDFSGWISHSDLSKYLNQLRLLVLPSYTEGLPNIMLEAMACGTPVLATPVGAICDVIIDGETGFIMESNAPECIAENVVRALSSPELEQIAENGRRFVGKNFTFEKVVENWKRVLQEIS